MTHAHMYTYIYTEREIIMNLDPVGFEKKSFIKEGKIIKNLSSLIVSVKSSHIIISYIFMRFRTGIACWEHLSAEQYICSFTTIHLLNLLIQINSIYSQFVKGTKTVDLK